MANMEQFIVKKNKVTNAPHYKSSLGNVVSSLFLVGTTIILKLFLTHFSHSQSGGNFKLICCDQVIVRERTYLRTYLKYVTTRYCTILMTVLLC